MTQKAQPQRVLAYDLGGTKVAVGIVDRRGRVVEEKRVPVVIEQGKKAVLKQLKDLGKEFLARYPEIERVGIASAGPLHSASGILLDPTNFMTKSGEIWGRVAITKILSQSLGRPVVLENDAAAAILAEKWVGAAKKIPNAMILTLGTGLGTGILIDGQLVRAGRGMHPEAGHLIVNLDDPDAICGCGNIGCAEAFLSGNGFSRWISRRLGRKLDGAQLADLARRGNREAKKAFADYAYILAATLHNFVMIYEPEIFIFTGSFAAAADLFVKPAEKHLAHMLRRRCKGMGRIPKLVISRLENHAGLIGGAYVAFFHH